MPVGVECGLAVVGARAPVMILHDRHYCAVMPWGKDHRRSRGCDAGSGLELQIAEQTVEEAGGAIARCGIALRW